MRNRSIVNRDLRTFRAQQKQSRYGSDFETSDRFFVYGDRAEEAGVAKGHYFHQDLIVARKIFRMNPRRHIDVGSSIYGFVSHVASFRSIEVLDVRDLKSQIEGIHFFRQDVMELDSDWFGVADSVSCLHALEHFGLGRYGDEVDFDGWRKGLKGLHRLLEPEGILYLSVPTSSRQRVEFNAHRVFSVPFLQKEFEGLFSVENLAFVLDDGSLVQNVEPAGAEARRSFDAQYGLSIWELRKNVN